MKRFFSFFSGLRGKLTLTYTLVTVAALLALEVLLFILIFIFAALTNTSETEYFSDIIYTLAPQARPFMAEEPPDIAGLQHWLDEVYQSGYASLPPQTVFDSAAAPITNSSPLFIISPQREIIAQSPRLDVDLVGRSYAAPNPRVASVIDLAFSSESVAPRSLAVAMLDGDYLVAVRIRPEEEGDVLGVLLLQVAPPPSVLSRMAPTLFSILFVTALILLLAVAPFGILFGFIMSRGLTRRIEHLSQATEAWQQDDFSLLPQDTSRDELGRLSERFRAMAQEIKNLMQTKQELASLEERNRLARDLHDTVKQQVFATMMQVRAARNLLHQNPRMAEQRLYEAEKLIKASQQELALMIAELRPTTLQEKGLIPALKEFLQTWQQSSQILVNFTVSGAQPVKPPVEQALYRIVQEALSNVLRHSQATTVEIHLSFTEENLVLTLTDNGFGFDPHIAADNGFGLNSMRQRVLECRGQFEITAEPGEGTHIWLEIPISEE